MLVYVYGVYVVDKLIEYLEIICCVIGLYDVQIDIVYCGICYFDLYQVCFEWVGI